MYQIQEVNNYFQRSHVGWDMFYGGYVTSQRMKVNWFIRVYILWHGSGYIVAFLDSSRSCGAKDYGLQKYLGLLHHRWIFVFHCCTVYTYWTSMLYYKGIRISSISYRVYNCVIFDHWVIGSRPCVEPYINSLINFHIYIYIYIYQI